MSRYASSGDNLQSDEEDNKDALNGNEGRNSVWHNQLTIAPDNETEKPEGLLVESSNDDEENPDANDCREH